MKRSTNLNFLGTDNGIVSSSMVACLKTAAGKLILPASLKLMKNGDVVEVAKMDKYADHLARSSANTMPAKTPFSSWA